MDRDLHAERLDGGAKRVHRRAIDELPDGVFVALNDAVAAGLPSCREPLRAAGRGAPADPVEPELMRHAFAVRGDELLRWTPSGYDGSLARPRRCDVDVLTPPSIIAVLAHGYRPRWHGSANFVSAPIPATNLR
jgi:hypothetical protein